MKKQVAVIVANGVEELEAVAPIDILRRAGVEVQILSATEDLEVISKGHIKFLCEGTLSSVKDALFDAVFIPGGPSVMELRKNELVLAFLKKHAERHLFTICAGPLVFKDAGLLEGKKITGHFSVVDELPQMDTKAAVVVDGNLVTSQGPGTSIEFALKLVEVLCGKAKRDEVAQGICYAL